MLTSMRSWRSLTPLLGLLLLAACGSMPALNAQTEAVVQPAESFDVAMDVSESDLDDQRGGFAGPNGLHIDFGLTTSTRVNGAIVSNFTLSSKNIGSLNPQNLQQIIQVGSANSYTPSTASTLNNNVLTLIQNNVNNTTISSTNVLNIKVSNFADLRNQITLQNSLGALVRASH